MRQIRYLSLLIKYLTSNHIERAVDNNNVMRIYALALSSSSFSWSGRVHDAATEKEAMKPVRWGILGTGRIAHLFARDLRLVSNAQLAAVGSRSVQSAALFAETHNIPYSYGSYEALAQSPQVDIVYIATPHTYHSPNTVLCLRAGKHVLCEKPFAMNTPEAEGMVQAARKENRFLMEAMWTMCLPSMLQAQKLIRDGSIGTPTHLDVTCGFQATAHHSARLWDQTLGGGALLDMGIYPITLATAIWGEPAEFEATSQWSAANNVDSHTTISFRFACGALASMQCSIVANMSNEAVVRGTEGTLRIRAPWWHSQQLHLGKSGDRETIIDAPFLGHGLAHEAILAMDALNIAAYESPVVPHTATLRNMRALDAVCRCVGFLEQSR